MGANMVYKAICVRDCFWNKKRWHVNDTYEGAIKPPHHFEIVDVEQRVFPIRGNPLAKEKDNVTEAKKAVKPKLVKKEGK